MNAGPEGSPSSHPSAPLRELLVVLFMCALGFAGYRNSLDTPFVHDDEPAITENPRIRSLWPFGSAGYAVQSTEEGRPVVRFTLALNHALGELELSEDGALAPLARSLGIGTGGLSVRGYHLFNLALHVLSALVLLGVVRRTLRLPLRVLDRWRPSAELLSFLVAAIWLIHPLQTDAVTYVIQRTELLMGLFYLLTLYASIRALDSPWRTLWSVVAVVSCALGMGSKEVMATAPIIVVLYDRAFVFARWRDLLRRRRSLYVGLASTWVILAALVMTGPRDETVGLSLGVAWWQYGATQLGMILHYLRLAFWPDSLCLDYGRVLASTAGEIVPGAIVVAALLVGTLWALLRRPALGFLGAWFFLILGPSSSIVPIITEVGAERRMHMPLAALVVLFVLLAERASAFLFQRRAPAGVGSAEMGPAEMGPAERTSLLAGGGLLLALMCVVTVRRNAVYESDLTIWQDTVAKRPDNSAAHNNLGRAYARRGRFEEAHAEFLTAIRLPFPGTDAFGNLGKALNDLERPEEAVRYLQQVLRDNPDYWEGHAGLAKVHLGQERWTLAVAEYQVCIENGYRTADLHNDLGKALFRLGRLREAAQEMHNALELEPDHALAAANLVRLEQLLPR